MANDQLLALLIFTCSFSILPTQQTVTNEALLRLLSEACPYRGIQQKGGPLPMELWIHFNSSAFGLGILRLV